MVLINQARSGAMTGEAAAQMLSEELPEQAAFEYTYVAAEGTMGLLEWTSDDSAVRVRDGSIRT